MGLPTTYRVRLENARGGRRTVIVYAPTPTRARELAARLAQGSERVISVVRQRP